MSLSPFSAYLGFAAALDQGSDITFGTFRAWTELAGTEQWGHDDESRRVLAASEKASFLPKLMLT